VMTGMEFLVQVKARAPFSSIPFMLYSGNITDELQRQAYQLGAMTVLHKPYKLSDFMVIVAQALETP
ncbi:MAG: response regulator, partial [Nitrospirota bacterium]|nr:response regulator [Nitrospirota bacterium]